MKAEELARLLALGEGQTIEFKATANAAVVGRHVCAFLNSGGGYLVLGVGANGELVGVKHNDDRRALLKLEQQVVQGLAPAALVSFEAQQVAGKTLWVVEVPAGRDVPYSYRDEVLIREGELTRHADVATLRDMILRRQVEPERWERRFSDADPDDDLDQAEIVRAIQRVKSSLHAHWNESEINVEQALERWGVMRYGRLTNGGDVLFARSPALRHPQVRVRCAAYSSEKTDDKYGDFKSFEGPLVAVLENVFAFVRRNTSSLSQFNSESLVRQDRGIYPDSALREALVNAFAHRNYADFRGGIRVQVFPRRVEVWNSGALPEGVTPEGLETGQISVLRNPDIAHVLYLQGFMEKLGRGGLLISRTLADQGLPPPEWQSDAHGVTLTLRAPEVAPEATPEVAPEVTPEVTPEVAPEVTPEVMRVMEALVGEMSRRELQQALGLRDSEHFRKHYLQPALAIDAVRMTLPEKPTSSRQRYTLTSLGKCLQALVGSHD
ncbi:Fic family protein [Pseudomonas mosselii]|uniref:Fic family protein n=1 Tax=Pseudomonas mosselii TaxID=78327 RepID=UPI000D8374E8|nr:RNA-binding domain-containing protein [Pseudomonas mosselii]PYC19447.1 transcriptional regulator [Pseudomonas mosselii]